MRQGLVKEKEILAYPPFGILGAEVWKMFSGYLSRLEVPLLQTNIGDQAIWWEYLALRGEAYWRKEGRALTANVARYKTEPMALMNDWNAAMAERTAA